MEARERVRRYIRGLRDALSKVDWGSLPPGFRYERLRDAIERYLSDAEYYLAKGDDETALVAVSYAEGLLDSLKYLGLLDIEWPKPIEEKRVFVGGTFDIIHPGHIALLEYAARLGKVFVVIARDSTVKKLKGRPPLLSEDARLRVISSIRYVYEARLGYRDDFLRSVEDIRPDVIVLGPDQKFDEDELADTIEERLGYRPVIERFKGKIEFSDGMKSTSDIIRKACSSSLCRIL